MADLADTDPVAEALAWLQHRPRIDTEFGGTGHVSGLAEAPWPHLVVAPGAGDGTLGELRWSITEGLSLEVWDDPRGTVGYARLRRLAIIAASELMQIVDRPAAPGQPVVTYCIPNGIALRSPQVNGQRRYILGMSMTLHPATG